MLKSVAVAADEGQLDQNDGFSKFGLRKLLGPMNGMFANKI